MSRGDAGEFMAGNIGGALRVGDTVRRRTGAWSPGVHALLTYLAEQGLAGAPRPLGTDGDDLFITSR